MKYLTLFIMLMFFITAQIALAEPAESELEESAARGERLWGQEFSTSGQQRSCASCHKENPGAQGQHIRTHKLIAPMSPSVNPQRLTDPKKIEKWFMRNCKWTIGRECDAQQKDDFIAYLKTWKGE